jgi:hypothetical protein
MRVLLWHVHGSWTTAFVQGPHTYLLPLMPGRGPGGRGRAPRGTVRGFEDLPQRKIHDELARRGLARFLADWDRLLGEVVR